ncbi:MAG TPA: hypothetical protein VFD43_01740 [Planctomycetota bacterium]|nr:hypothetical protein [Planctomycetota bacterium]
MTFANGFARGVALTALALGSMGVVSAQNGTNYHVLSNDFDGIALGIGAGGAQTPGDGLGTFIPGEDLRGSLKVDFGGTLGIQFSYRLAVFRESPCVVKPGLVSGTFLIQYDGLYFIELDGLNANNNVVFERPVCTTPIAASFLAYGTGPSSSASFVLSGVPSVFGAQTVLLPDNGLVAATGTATIVFALQNDYSVPGSGCYIHHFTFAGNVDWLDNIDGAWHYLVNSEDQNQYWGMTFDEMNLTRSNTVGLDAGQTALTQFFAPVEYDMQWATREASTLAVLAPHAVEQNGPYYAQTENMNGGGGPNFGFDAGRGSRAISFSGLGGTKTPPGLGGLGNGAQDPAYDVNPPAVRSLGFVTWDNKANSSVAGMGSARVPWLCIDLAQIGGLPPESDPDITKMAGQVRLPVIGTGFIQPVTSQALLIFNHVAKVATSGWPDPANGVASGWPAVPPIAGGSIQFNVGPFVAKVPCAGTFPVNLTYGTTGRHHTPPPTLTWDPAVADISGSREIYLWK